MRGIVLPPLACATPRISETLDTEPLHVDRRFAPRNEIRHDPSTAARERPSARPMAEVDPQARATGGADHGWPVRQHRPGAFPGLHLSQLHGAGEPVVEHLVERAE